MLLMLKPKSVKIFGNHMLRAVKEKKNRQSLCNSTVTYTLAYKVGSVQLGINVSGHSSNLKRQMHTNGGNATAVSADLQADESFHIC